MNEDDSTQLSIVMPCLNEAETLEICIEKAQRSLRENAIAGEVVVADNGSTDGSIEIAERRGTKLVRVVEDHTEMLAGQLSSTPHKTFRSLYLTSQTSGHSSVILTRLVTY